MKHPIKTTMCIVCLASMGLLATGGFAAALALADSESHAAVGSVSGIVFTLAVVIVYF